MGNTKSTAGNSFTSKGNIEHNTSLTTASSLVSGTHLNDHRPRRRIIQNFFLIWVDSCIDESTKHYHDIITQLQGTVNTIYTYTNIHSCVDFFTKIGNEKTFLIVSSSLSQQLIPLIHDIPQLDAIYVFNNETTTNNEWTEEWSKMKGVYTQIPSICEALQQDVKQCNRNYIPVSFVPFNDGAMNPDLDQLDPSFMYTQIFKEILLKNKYDQKSMEDLVAYCRQQYDANRPILNIIAEFEREYNNQLSIWWYTRSCFTYEMLNRALRNLEADTILKMGFFIHDLHSQIKKLHFQQFGNHQGEAFTVYRGQGLPESDFEKLMKSKGGLISFNNFLSTSIDRSISFMYAESNSFKLNTIGILFDIRINPSISSSPFARIDNISYFNYEGEVLFSMHTVFRIGDIKQIENNTRLWRVELELTDNKDQQLSKLTDQIRQETLGTTGYERLGKLLIKIGQTQKAEELYQVLLDQTFDQHEKSVFYLQIGDIRDDEGRYENAISFYEKALEIEENHSAPDQSKLGAIYMNIGLVYMKMGEHTKAKEINEKSVEILQKISSLNYPDLATSSNHPDLTTSYIDVGETNNEIRDYSKALSYQEQALEITGKTFPPNHPHLAASYNNIGVVYHNMREYSKALSFYEKAHEIFQTVLPPNHPSLATTYNNIGSVYKNIGEYSKAFSYHEKSLEIRQKALSPNHPDLAISYTNIGMLYENMREYSKARSHLERAIEIFQRSLPPNHPDLQAVRNNIELVKMKPQIIVND